MTAELKKLIAGRLGARARFGEPMSRHTTWGVGGPAWCLARVNDAAEAVWLATACDAAGLAYKPLGRGSNLLVGDAGYPGVMIRMGGELGKLSLEGSLLRAGAGAPLPGAVRLAARQGLAGLEWAAGIPASLGGAVATNAGAHGGDMAELTATVSLLIPGGEVSRVAGNQLPAGYRRRSLPPGSMVLGAELKLKPSSAAEVERRRKALLDLRRSRQPLAARTAGSVFKNPPGDHAGRLIEAAGLKGLAVGDAVVSRVHANFIENRGRASAGDILSLINTVALKVMEAFSVRLEPEVEVVGV
ncbi:MAG: UDP-N-acetylmuramate dehydrogenase [Desulfarculaceae bacterium]|nr:UDP-N-acetylmuramate dehydrogenase [Desulfarculaceae bacterium]MCF8070909.1 UDP-N-acetylmuramate dehydrogenase [Desulfarculaceae bacterium]MCF8100497.1 UDP-N-acetylmuramate dehydrogenase [Desulfarculaceae bacterium]MCF8116523.1 UDP-N-acetylmuramate dehydrogenase [Desulfarculaceae bacterium]